MRVVMVALEERRTVAEASDIEAEVAIRLVMVPEAERKTVAEASDETRLVMEPEVAIRLVMVPEAERKTVKDASAQVKLDGLVPTSIIALVLLMLKRRLSAVLIASSAPPAALVKLAVVGTALGVSLFFVRITGISRCLRLKFLWH